MIRAAVLAIAFLAAPGAMAQTVCIKASELAQQAKGRWKEHPVAAAVINNGVARLVVYASKKGTFTLAVVNPNGIACVVMTGDGWATADIPVEEMNP